MPEAPPTARPPPPCPHLSVRPRGGVPQGRGLPGAVWAAAHHVACRVPAGLPAAAPPAAPGESILGGKASSWAGGLLQPRGLATAQASEAEEIGLEGWRGAAAWGGSVWHMPFRPRDSLVAGRPFREHRALFPSLDSHRRGQAGGAWGCWVWDLLWLWRLPTWPLVWSGQIRAAMPGPLSRSCLASRKSSLTSGLGPFCCRNKHSLLPWLLGWGDRLFLSAETLLCPEPIPDNGVGSSQGRRGAIRPVESQSGLVFQP